MKQEMKEKKSEEKCYVPRNQNEADKDVGK